MINNNLSEEEWFNKGLELYNIGKHEEAIKAFKKVIEINPGNYMAWYNKGVALGNLGKYEEAIKAYEKAIEIKRDYANAWHNKGFALGRLNNHKKAIKAFKKSIKINPNDYESWINIGVEFDGLKKNKNSIRAFEKAIKINPENDKAWYNKGIELYKIEKYKEAVKIFDKAIEINPKNDMALNNKAVQFDKLGECKTAIKAYEEAIKINPKNTLAYNNIVELFINLGDIKTASKKNEETLKVDNDSSSALFLKGKIKIEEKKYDEAGESFRKTISLDYGNPKIFLWHAYANYLNAEFSLNLKDKKYIRDKRYQEEISSIIRELEKANKLIANKKNNEKKDIKAYILYFLACFYIKSKADFTAKEKLEECIKLKSPIKKTARELLRNIWNYKIKPPWWRWWLNSPLYRWTKRIVFIVLSLLSGLLLLHPFIPKWIPFFQENSKVNWNLYIFIIILLIIILISPSIEHIKTKDVEVDLHSPPNFESGLSPIIMEGKIMEMENIQNLKQQF